MTTMTLCSVVGRVFQIALKSRIDVFNHNFRAADAARVLTARTLVIAALSAIAAISGQPAWIPCIGFIAAWSFHFYLLQRYVGSTYKMSTIPSESSEIATVMMVPQGFITTGTMGGIAQWISFLVFIAYAVGFLNVSPPMLRTLMLAVAGLVGGVLAMVTMLGILALQTSERSGMPRSQFAKGLQGFALSFIVLLAASLAAVLFLPDELPDVASGRSVIGGQALVALALLIYVLTSLPRNLVYFLSLVWDILRPITQSGNGGES